MLNSVRAVVTNIGRLDLKRAEAHGALPVILRQVMEFYDIYDEYYDRIRTFLSSVVKDRWAADDLAQETFIKVKRHLPQLRDTEKLSSWIFRIACNLSRDYFKRQINQESEEVGPEHPALGIPLMKTLEQKQMSDCVQEKFNLLPEQSRMILTLYDVMEFSHQEIADILSISEVNAKVRLHRARKQFKAILQKHCVFEVDERNVVVCEPVRPGSY